jgi:hypothetical protein
MQYFALNGIDHRTHAAQGDAIARYLPLAQCWRPIQTQRRPQLGDQNVDQFPERDRRRRRRRWLHLSTAMRAGAGSHIHPNEVAPRPGQPFCLDGEELGGVTDLLADWGRRQCPSCGTGASRPPKFTLSQRRPWASRNSCP